MTAYRNTVPQEAHLSGVKFKMRFFGLFMILGLSTWSGRVILVEKPMCTCNLRALNPSKRPENGHFWQARLDLCHCLGL